MVSGFEAEKLVFLDETGAWLDMPRLYARCVGGQRVYDSAARRRKGKLSLLAAVTSQGVNPEACMIHEGSVDTQAFLSYLEHVLLPTLKPGQVVIMDNFTIHHNREVRKLIESAGCRLLYLPTYSPDFNPIELLFSKLKAFVRKLRPKTLADLFDVLAQAVLHLDPEDARNAFRYCGYQ